MNPRQRYAVTHPLNRGHDALKPQYRADRPHKTGMTIRTILAVDR